MLKFMKTSEGAIDFEAVYEQTRRKNETSKWKKWREPIIAINYAVTLDPSRKMSTIGNGQPVYDWKNGITFSLTQSEAVKIYFMLKQAIGPFINQGKPLRAPADKNFPFDPNGKQRVNIYHKSGGGSKRMVVSLTNGKGKFEKWENKQKQVIDVTVAKLYFNFYIKDSNGNNVIPDGKKYSASISEEDLVTFYFMIEDFAMRATNYQDIGRLVTERINLDKQFNNTSNNNNTKNYSDNFSDGGVDNMYMGDQQTNTNNIKNETQTNIEEVEIGDIDDMDLSDFDI